LAWQIPVECSWHSADQILQKERFPEEALEATKPEDKGATFAVS
jgi:hypothetical protein